MSFAWPWLFLALPLPWLVRRWLAPVLPDAALRVPATEDFLAPADDRPRPAGRGNSRLAARSVAAAAWLLLVVAAARPQWLDAAAPLPVSGRDLIVALDVSASMGTRDLKVGDRVLSRLDIARALAADVVARREGDRVGLIVFGDAAHLHTPLTYDLAAVRAGLAAVDVGLAGQETALGDAVALAATRLHELGDSARVLILLTDGANTAGQLDPAGAGWLAARESVRIHVLGIGATADLDEDALRSLAQRTGGSYHRAADAAGLSAFVELIERLEPVARGDLSLRPARELHAWPLGIALGLVAWLALRRSVGSVA